MLHSHRHPVTRSQRLQRVCFVGLLALLLTTVASAQDDRRRRGRRGLADMMRRLPVMLVLDADSDGELSKAEIEGAHKALLTLDMDKDGNITLPEITPEELAGGNERARRGPPMMGPGGRSRMLPIMVALDQDGDGELFDDEVSEASRYLLVLDKNADGKIDAAELAPEFRRRGPGGRRGGPGGGGRGEPREGGAIQPADLERKDGVARIPDRATFKEMGYQGDEVMIDTQLRGIEFVKFQIEDAAAADQSRIYFINTKTHRAHMMFMGAIGLERGGHDQMRGVLSYRPMLRSPGGATGHYTFEFEPQDDYEFELVKAAYDQLVKHAPILQGNLSYHLLPFAKLQYLTETDKYDEAQLPVFEESTEQFADIAFLPLHRAQSFGRLRLMKQGERPGARDVVLYPTLPNEMPRVAGIITGVRQTPLSHVNLRAVQDDVPNAYIAGAQQDAAITALLGKYVYYSVAADGYELREASTEEVDAHFADLRPTSSQVPRRDLSVRAIQSLADVGFADAGSIGVKAANLATLRKFGLRDKLVPDGFAVPFFFYDEFMKNNGLYEVAKTMIQTPDFKSDADVRARVLGEFRKRVEQGKFPTELREALAAVQKKFKGKPIRCRSSTNNEDLPGYSGAGLYDSFTHRKKEGHLAKSIKQVFASAWNFRAFEEREFHRIDHLQTAMGVLLHRNQSKERVNGVAVTEDVLYHSKERSGPRFYVNAQMGENLVTNPGSGSTPEEILLSHRNPRTDTLVQRASGAQAGERLMKDKHLLELRRALRVIDREFRLLYGKSKGDLFAMEVEFKVTRKGKLLIKQARPWVYPEL